MATKDKKFNFLKKIVKGAAKGSEKSTDDESKEGPYNKMSKKDQAMEKAEGEM